jgi:hypothetical protein
LQPYLPPRFVLREPALITVEAAVMTEVEWLAGRGYNLISVRIPVVFDGGSGRVPGALMLVLWENLADAVISGREELGYNKLYAEISHRAAPDTAAISASWLGFNFFEMELTDLAPCAPSDVVKDANSQGTFHIKYIPRTGDFSNADVSYVTFGPRENPPLKVSSTKTARGTFHFLRARWQDLPTQYHIVNALCDIPLLEFRGASISVSRGFKDLSDQMILT